MKTHTLNPLNYSELTYFHDSFRFMTFADLEAERQCFEDALNVLNVVGKPGDYDVSEEALKVATLVSELIGFAQTPTIEQLLLVISKIHNDVLCQLKTRIHQLSRAFHGTSLLEGVDYKQTDVCVVSPIWHRRWSDLIYGELRPAFVGHCLVEAY